MAKRFTSTEIWHEDWFLDMPNEYKLYWYYMLSHCDHSGIFKVNLRSFCGQLEVKMTSTKALSYFNAGKQRIRVITDTIWLIEEFFYYQYGETYNPNNRVHFSIGKLYKKYGIDLTSIRGLKDLKHGVKDKDKDKDKDNSIVLHTSKLFNTMPVAENFNGLPEMKVGAVIELMRITKQVSMDKEQVNGLWQVFKVQNLTGKKYYQSEDDVYSHFINWSKTQKIEKNSSHAKKELSDYEKNQQHLRDKAKNMKEG